MISPLRIAIVLAGYMCLSLPAAATVATKVTEQAIEMAVENAAKISGKKFSGTVTKKVATEEVKRLAETHGADVLKVVEDSGLELLEAVPKHGDDLVLVAMKASPQARRALALSVEEMLPLAKRVGVEALELEAKVPGQAAHAFEIFGDAAGKGLARSIPTEDLPRLVKYGEKADNAATRELLLKTYKTEGPKLFERIPPKLVLAGGLSASMLLGTHEAFATERAKADVLRDNPEIARDVMNQSTMVWGGIVLVVILLLLWRFGLMPWHGRRSKSD
jgi:hypothetical protein